MPARPITTASLRVGTKPWTPCLGARNPPWSRKRRTSRANTSFEMKIHEVEQGTLDWLRLHIGIPTASGLDNLLDSKFALRTGEMPKTYLFKKVAESWRGQPLVSI